MKKACSLFFYQTLFGHVFVVDDEQDASSNIIPLIAPMIVFILLVFDS
jgi:hypothetical protein